MTRPLRLLALLSLGLLALLMSGIAPAAAQDTDDILGELDDFGELNGLQSGVMRSFLPDFSALAGTPDAEPAAGEATPDMGLSLDGAMIAITGVLQFDSEENAAAAIETIRNEEADEDEVTAIEIEGLDTETTAAYSIADEDDGVSFTGTLIATQDGSAVVFAILAGIDADTLDATTELVTGILETEAGTGEPQFDASGGSTGGDWDRLPTGEEDVLAGLPNTQDVEVTPGDD